MGGGFQRIRKLLIIELILQKLQLEIGWKRQSGDLRRIFRRRTIFRFICNKLVLESPASDILNFNIMLNELLTGRGW